MSNKTLDDCNVAPEVDDEINYNSGDHRYMVLRSGGRYRMRSVEAVTPDGARWTGQGSDGMDAVTLRRVKG